ncbi:MULTISPECIES: hypothetical protein [Hydrogenophaga]|uniref:Transmembrane protein n=1 Tax=Hydrogenophaga intermedia TaxID=65786 RepID=A0A1L1PJR1_HYDIT|nr:MULTISPECIES: hypothetical protein [Hydrogenophaga]TMU75513.1 hypothetical protein FGJ01_10345 [Hydrogenophaga intermedia]CDN87989.1 hypothetical protein BN948_02419 [Hydrogenophaga intermedia]
MGIETPRLMPLVPASQSHTIRKRSGGSLTLHDPAKGMPMPGNSARGHGEKTAPHPLKQKTAAMGLSEHLKKLQDSKCGSFKRLLSTPRSDTHAPHESESETEISQKQFDADDLEQEHTSFEASDDLPRPDHGKASSLVQSERHSPEDFRLKAPVPMGSTAAELKNVVHHRKGYTDQKKQIGLAGWGAGLAVEGTAAIGTTLTGVALGMTALAAWASITSLATWIGNIYDGFEARGSFLLSEKNYEEARTLRDKAIGDRLILATALAKEGKLEEGKAYLDAAREMVAMMDEVLKGHEGYLAPAEADLLAERRALELRINDELVEIKRGKLDQAELDKLLHWLELMPEDKYKRDDALHDLKIQRADLEAKLGRLKALPASDSPADAAAISDLTAELKRVQANIDRLELINKQKKYPSLLRATKHLGPKKVKGQRDEDVTYIRLPADFAATLITYVGMTLGFAATGFVGPAVTILMSPFWMRSARLDIEDAHRSRLTADANLTAILNKLALGRAMLAHFDGLPTEQQSNPQTRLGKSIAHNLISAALREYKQAMRDKNLSAKKELKGAGLRYVGIPAVVMFAAAAIVTGALFIGTGGIAFGVTAALTAIGVGAYYGYSAHLKKKAKQDKHEAKRRQAAALWVESRVSDVRTLFTGDSKSVHAEIARLRAKAPATLLPYINEHSLLHRNEYLMSMALSEEYANAPTDPATPLDIDSAPFAVQMTQPLGLTDQRNNFLLHNDPLLDDPEHKGLHKKRVALTTLASLFGDAKVYEADRLPDHATDQARDVQLTEAVDALNSLIGTQQHQSLTDLIAEKGSLEAIEEWVRKDPVNARFMQRVIADLRTRLIDLLGVPLGQLAELSSQIKSRDNPTQLLLELLLTWKDAPLKGTQDAKAVTTPPVGVRQFEKAIRRLGKAQMTALQRKRLKKGHLLFAGGRSVRTPKQWLKYLNNASVEEQALVLGNLVSTWRDTLRNQQGEIEVPKGFASEDDYLSQVMQDTRTQYASLSESVADHASHEQSKLFATLQERFDSSMKLADLCVEHLSEKRQKAQQEQRAARAVEPEIESQAADSVWWDDYLNDLQGLPTPRNGLANPVN